MRRESGRALFETLNWWLDPFMTTLVRAERIAAPILAVIARHMPIDRDKVIVRLDRGDGVSTLEIDVEMPDRAAARN